MPCGKLSYIRLGWYVVVAIARLAHREKEMQAHPA